MKVLTYFLLLVSMATSAEEATHTAARAAMVEEVRRYAQILDGPDEARISDAVMAAMNAVKRHELVPQSERRFAYENRPLPIGYGQTISQPYIVALMTELIEPDVDDVVLEVGTGSGYQAAILAHLARRVYAIERHRDLALAARERMSSLDLSNVSIRTGDGTQGWPEQAPFDRIIVSAAAEDTPSHLLEQLRPGGIMVLPVGLSDEVQQLIRIEKTENGLDYRELGRVLFVPLVAGMPDEHDIGPA